MAPQTRNGRKKVVKVIPGTTVELKKNCGFKWIFKNKRNRYGRIGNDIIKDTILKIDRMTTGNKDSDRILNYYRNALSDCIKVGLEGLSPENRGNLFQIFPESHETPAAKTRKIKKELVVKEEVEAEKEEETMTISETSYTSEALAVRSETLTSSDDECDETAISQQLEEMSITEEMELNIPLHTSTPLRENSVISVIKQEEIQVFGVVEKAETTQIDGSEVRILKSSIKKTVISQREDWISKREVKPTLGLERVENQSESTINLETPTHSGYRRNLFATKSESVVSTLPKPEPSILRNPKPENIEKKNHLSFLRSKVLNTKLEKGREIMKQKAAVIERKSVQIEKKSSSYKSPARNIPILKRTEMMSSHHRPLKKTRVQTFPEKEKMAPLLKTPVPVLSVMPLLTEFKNNAFLFQIPDTTLQTNTLKKTDTSYQNKTLLDYGLDYLSNEEDTDDECNPKNKIPSWAANFDVIADNVRTQFENPPFDVVEFFGEIEKVLRLSIGDSNTTITFFPAQPVGNLWHQNSWQKAWIINMLVINTTRNLNFISNVQQRLPRKEILIKQFAISSFLTEIRNAFSTFRQFLCERVHPKEKRRCMQNEKRIVRRKVYWSVLGCEGEPSIEQGFLN
ncbi:hypothetical protein CRE_29552 [Caenorhabditis remanei]|uniref:Inner centromere protein ARK-binding domain-containing protein n=1 Tax=Caenorhabditis remanei TaxID=31234 RepID=E3LVM6_CAERE|nr:hypothetical protein CRE_29552 [Caenorhabditis remanei]